MKMARTCACGRRVEPGQTCRVCGPKVTQPRPRAAYRSSYTSAAYRKNRILRYALAGGRCEYCGVALRGPLHPDDGVPWQSDHQVEIARGGSDEVSNLRVFCVPHHTMKTRISRRARRGSGGNVT